MKIGMACEAYHYGNPAEFLSKSFRALGHTVDIINRFELETSFRKKQHDVYICVDSGAAIDLFNACYLVDAQRLKKLAFWFIDYRHNKNRPPHERNPNDQANAAMISTMGGWVFQAQFPDVLDCWNMGIDRTSWLPLAADPEIFTHTDTPKVYDVSFVGNVWDSTRAAVLQRIYDSKPQRLIHNISGGFWKELAARLMCEAKAGFNISSFYGTPLAYDVNMRFFETLSCGLPIITNYVDDLIKLLGPLETIPFVRTYRSEEQVLPVLDAAMQDEKFLNSGVQARQWVLDVATYDMRAKQMTDALYQAGVWPQAQEA